MAHSRTAVPIPECGTSTKSVLPGLSRLVPVPISVVPVPLFYFLFFDFFFSW